MKRPVLFSLMLLLCFSAAGIWFAAATPAGLRLIYSCVGPALPENFSIAAINGRLIGPLKLRGIQYRDKETLVSLDSLRVDWCPIFLLSGELRFSLLDGKGLTIKSGAGGGKPQPLAAKRISLPLRITIRKARLRGISIIKEDGKSFAIKEISSELQAARDLVRLRQFKALATDFNLQAQGEAHLKPGYPFTLHTAWAVRSARIPEAKGRGSISGSLAGLRVVQQISTPVSSRLEAAIENPLSGPSWQAKLIFTGLNPALLNRQWPAAVVAGTLRSKGNLAGYGLSADLRAAANKLPAMTGRVEGNGNKDGFSIRKLSVRSSAGEVEGSGRLGWEPELTFDLSLAGQGINPGEIKPAWPGSLRLQASVAGRRKDGELQTQVKGTIRGRLRGYRFSSTVDLGAKGRQVAISAADLRSSHARLRIAGRVADNWHISWQLQAPHLKEVWPELQGALAGHGKVDGPLAVPIISAVLQGRDLSGAGVRAGGMEASLALDLADKTESRLALKATALAYASQEVGLLTIRGSGRLARHHLAIRLQRKDLDIELTAAGGLKQGRWQGLLRRADFMLDGLGRWRLARPTPLLLARRNVDLREICWIGPESRLCLNNFSYSPKAVAASLTASHLPLALIEKFAAGKYEGLTLQGHFDADASLAWKVGAPQLTLDIHGSAGSLSLPVTERTPATFAFSSLALKAALDKGGLEAVLQIPLRDGGLVRGRLGLPGLRSWPVSAGQKIAGSLNAEIRELGIISALFPQLGKLSGVVKADVKIGGKISSPLLTGRLAIERASTAISQLGVRLKGHLTAASDGSGLVRFTGAFASGPGDVSLKGSYDLRSKRGAITIKGQNFEAVHLAEARALVSPDLRIKLVLKDKRIDLSGTVRVPEAEIKPSEQQGVSKVSEDVVIADQEEREQKGAGWHIYSNLQLVLGNKVRFVGFGLRAKLKGGVALQQKPGSVSTAAGTVDIVEGVYKAYGTSLNIEQGKLIFTGGPVDNPWLDVRAVRKKGEVTAGLRAAGTLRKPRLTLYSDPAMEQTDILSYLILGKPLSGATSNQGRTLYNAASSLSLTGGEFVAKRIGLIFGIQDVKIEQGAEPNEASLVLGKYLSPDLYVSYGRGIFAPTSEFKIKYQISKRWLIQTNTGTQSGADLFYTYEH